MQTGAIEEAVALMPEGRSLMIGGFTGGWDVRAAARRAGGAREESSLR